jgi:hypothetical protein
MAIFTTGQAGGQAIQPTSVPTAYSADAQELARSQRLAQLLSNQQMPEGQMISGRFVAPSIAQNLAQFANMATGAYFADKSEKQNLALAKKIREGENAALADYMAQMQGRPAVEGGVYGPDGKLTMQTTPDMIGPQGELTPQYRQVAPSPAIPANPRAANLNAAQNDMLPSWMRQFAMKEVTKGPDYKEIKKLNEATGNIEIFRYNASAPDPRSTMEFLGIDKPAISASDRLTLQDKGINIPPNLGGGGGSPAGGNMPVSNVPVAGNPAVPAQPNVKPAVKPATTASTQDLVATYGYDPFKLPPMPPQPSGEAARDWQKKAYQPLEGTAGQKVDGAKMYYNSLEKYNNYVSTLTAADLANPSVRSRLNSLYATAKLTGKEANNLGVLNGGDERILEEVLPNYKDITVTKKNLNRIVQDQKEFASGIIVEAYGTQQKVVPQNMRKFIVVPATQDVRADTPAKNAPVQRAVLNNQQIETRNGKWVYSATGKAVE